jgi:hypothetical protein
MKAPLLASCLLFASVAHAEATRAEYDYIDSNDDGYVSSSEHEVYARQLFNEMDGDPPDYKLSKADILANHDKFFRHVFCTGNMLGGTDLSDAEKIERMDANKDGVISRDEHASAAAAKFQHMDINNNGELDPDEYDAGL